MYNHVTIRSSDARGVPLQRVCTRRNVDAVEDTPESRKAIGDRIQRARLSAGYENAAEFARHVGVSPNTIYRWERGDVSPDIFRLESVSRVARVSTDWILRGSRQDASGPLETWLDTPRGRSASESAKQWLRELPIGGFVPSPAFFDLALLAFEQGLTPEEAVLAARFTESKKGS
jgi:transcriptional regulator with XRE-family HTH domain